MSREIKQRAYLRFYSENNLGDDLFAKLVCDRYDEQFIANISRTGLTLSKTSNLQTKRNQVVRLLNKPIKLLYPLLQTHIWKDINQSSVQIHIGGSLFIENKNTNEFVEETSRYMSSTTPYYFIGPSLEVKYSKKYKISLRQLLSNSVDTCFRDMKSYQTFKDLRSKRYAPDVAFTLRTDKYENTKSKEAIMSLIDCSKRFDNDTYAQYEKNMAMLTRKLIDEGYEVTYMSFCKFEGDEKALSRVKKLLPKQYGAKVKIYNYNGNLETALNTLSGAELVVGTRFHAIILGLLFKAKVLPVIYSDKTKNILEDTQFNGPTMDIRNLDAFDIDSFDPKKLKTFNVNKQIEQSEKQFQELDKVLVRRKTNE